MQLQIKDMPMVLFYLEIAKSVFISIDEQLDIEWNEFVIVALVMCWVWVKVTPHRFTNDEDGYGGELVISAQK